MCCLLAKRRISLGEILDIIPSYQSLAYCYAKILTVEGIEHIFRDHTVVIVESEQSVRVNIAKNTIDDVHKNVKTKREFISLLRVEAELICEKCADPERKKIFADFAEEIKLSDPMSNESLAEIEDDIMSTVKEAGRTISEGNEEYAVLLCKKARDLLHERNKKTYALKH